MPGARRTAARRTISLERLYNAPVETVWELWTTKEGFESWWGPAGFSTEVTAIDVRPGGQIVYVMSASETATRQFLERQGMPLATEQVLTVLEAVPNHRLVTSNVIDFVPGMKAYEVGMTVDLESTASGTRLVVTLDVMHDEHWTEMAVKGWESQLENLARVVAGASS